MYSKLIVFDLDGVLVETRELHYQTLNEAISKFNPEWIISRQDHIDKYNGLPTRSKLEILSKEKGLDKSLHSKIWDLKQELTYQKLSNDIVQDLRLQKIFEILKRTSMIHVASNATQQTVNLVLKQKGLLSFVDHYLASENVNRSKPNPEIYLRCMIEAGVGPNETSIVEDSPVGIQAATASGARVCPVSCPDDVSLDLLELK